MNDFILIIFQELNLLTEDANVFKMIGPALIKQDQVEAKSNVSKRIEYIKGEIGRIDGQLKGLDAKFKTKENEVCLFLSNTQSQKSPSHAKSLVTPDNGSAKAFAKHLACTINLFCLLWIERLFGSNNIID